YRSMLAYGDTTLLNGFQIKNSNDKITSAMTGLYRSASTLNKYTQFILGTCLSGTCELYGLIIWDGILFFSFSNSFRFYGMVYFWICSLFFDSIIGLLPFMLMHNTTMKLIHAIHSFPFHHKTCFLLVMEHESPFTIIFSPCSVDMQYESSQIILNGNSCFLGQVVGCSAGVIWAIIVYHHHPAPVYKEKVHSTISKNIFSKDIEIIDLALGDAR
ncbi:hypothetical protein ACJX0J_024222, partial [Zea mays]